MELIFLLSHEDFAVSLNKIGNELEYQVKQPAVGIDSSARRDAWVDQIFRHLFLENVLCFEYIQGMEVAMCTQIWSHVKVRISPGSDGLAIRYI